MTGGSGGGGSNTTTQIQQLPQWQQDYAQQNEQIAAGIASQPFPTYSGQTIADFNPQQSQSFNMVDQAANAQQPYLNQAQNMTQQAASPWDAQTAQQYMSPYAAAAMAPQLQQLQIQQDQQAKQIGSQATQAGAFGDARQGVAEGMNNFYGNLAQNDLMAQGMNTAYNTGQAAFNSDQSRMLQAGGQEAGLGQTAQDTGIAGAGALFNSGQQQQQQNQQQLTNSYNNFMNQFNYPAQNLNLRMSALSNTPYSQANYVSLAPNSGFGQLAGAATGLAGLLGGSSSGGQANSNIFGSDVRIKKNIKHVGFTKKHKLKLYEFNYLWEDDSNPHVGVLAHEVLPVIPDAVIIDASGYGKVNYDMVA